jgi:hypothetical protein
MGGKSVVLLLVHLNVHLKYPPHPLQILSFKLNVGHFPHLADLVTRINYNHNFMSDNGR